MSGCGILSLSIPRSIFPRVANASPLFTSPIILMGETTHTFRNRQIDRPCKSTAFVDLFSRGFQTGSSLLTATVQKREIRSFSSTSFVRTGEAEVPRGALSANTYSHLIDSTLETFCEAFELLERKLDGDEDDFDVVLSVSDSPSLFVLSYTLQMTNHSTKNKKTTSTWR